MPQILQGWDHSPVTWAVAPDAVFGTLTRQQVLGVFNWAIERWKAASGLKTAYLHDVASVDILAFVGPIGESAYGLVAFSESPALGRRQCLMRFNARTRWLNPEAYTDQQGDVSLALVALHEFGLALGLRETEKPGSIMSHVYSPRVACLQPFDLEGIQQLYGPSKLD
jgi:hypothetical protein